MKYLKQEKRIHRDGREGRARRRRRRRGMIALGDAREENALLKYYVTFVLLLPWL